LLRRFVLALLPATLAFALAAPAAAAASATCEGGETPLQVEIRDVRSADGNVTITVYGDRPEDFLSPGRKLLRERVPIVRDKATACLALPDTGAYAVAVYHDEDGDHDFDRTLIGLPDEGYGFSNDAPAIVGLPTFQAARFEVPENGLQLTIRMRY